MAMAAAYPEPTSMILERIVVRRDDESTFPHEEDRAPYRMDDHTYEGDPFSVALRIAKPPEVSRLYLKWEHGPKPGPSCVPVAAHRNLLLVGLVPEPDPAKMEKTLFSFIPYFEPQRLFLCRPPCSRYDPPDSLPLVLQHIPMCLIPEVLRVKKNGTEVTMDRRFELDTVGILSGGEDQFAVAQILLCSPSMEAELCILRSSINNREHTWELEKGLPILYEADEYFDLDAWTTQRVIPFNDYLCWVNYGIGGLLMCKVFEENPPVLYLRLPILNRSLKQRPLRDRNSSLGVTKGAAGLDDLIFIDIVRKDGCLTGPLTPGSGFSVSYYTLRNTEFGGLEWKLVFLLTSAQLWKLNKSIVHEALIFPHVSTDDPKVVFFLLSERGEGPKGFPKVKVVAIDMSTAKVISVKPYFEENGLSGRDSSMVLTRSFYLESFLQCDLPKFMRKDVFDASPSLTPTDAHPTPEVNIDTAVVPDCPAFNTRSKKKVAM